MYHLGIFKIFSFSINLSWKFIYRRVLFQNFIPLSQKNISITLSKIVKIWIKTSTWKHLQLHTFIWEVQIKISRLKKRIFSTREGSFFFSFFFFETSTNEDEFHDEKKGEERGVFRAVSSWPLFQLTQVASWAG